MPTGALLVATDPGSGSRPAMGVDSSASIVRGCGCALTVLHRSRLEVRRIGLDHLCAVASPPTTIRKKNCPHALHSLPAGTDGRPASARRDPQSLAVADQPPVGELDLPAAIGHVSDHGGAAVAPGEP